MKIGLISDTHDNLPLIKKAVDFFNNHNVGFVLHAGDFVAPFSIRAFEGLGCEWRGVFGNNDGERRGLSQISKNRIVQPPLFLEFASKKIGLVHEFQELDADIIVFGHTHRPEVKKDQARLIVNPGEAGGWLYGKPTVGILDLERLSVEIFPL